MQQLASISVVVPALNEAPNLASTIKNIKNTVSRFFDDWEIFIFNDGSTDATGSIAMKLAKEDPKILAVHHEKPKGIGSCYREGIELAKKDFLIMIPGDNECGIDVMERIFAEAGKFDLIIPYTANLEVRPLLRQILSRFFVSSVNLLSGNSLKYYNGAVLHRTQLLKKIPFKDDGFGYQAEILIALIKKNASYFEIPIHITYRPHGKSKALSLKSIRQALQFFISLGFSRLKELPAGSH